MPTTLTPQRAAWAVATVFFASGFAFASWASRLPAVRDALGFGEAQMGLLLLSAAVGSICALPLSGLVVNRLGAVRTVVIFAVVTAVGFAVTVVAVDLGVVWAVRAGLVVAGIGNGVWDAAMNIEGAAVERKLGRSLMPRLHAAFSLGTVAGAGVGALAAFLQVSYTVHEVAAMVVVVVTVLLAVRYFLPVEAPERVAPSADDLQVDPVAAPSAGRNQLAAWTERRTLLIGIVVLAAALTEGAANDWVSLAVVDGFGVADGMGALGLALFLSAMTGMRLLGTGLLDRFGRVAVLRLSAGLALVGLGVFATVDNLAVAMVGIVLWGAGAALGFPVGMSAASDDPEHAAVRVSVVATIGYSAFFIGPPLIGFLAHLVGYREALLVIAVPLVIGLFVVSAARPLPAADDEPAESTPGSRPGDAATN
ncbi:MFS transporter [Paraoerskovia marina]|uniref:Fucose permease n=1 Tax=Paraoerskovia marina TaxID=545619 RepID=A0A1H1VEN0_9CELL|nr:MFS transporter [Paraoerskovia marina]SDS83257.1 Fucose permease [Paraoerskovia marina]